MMTSSNGDIFLANYAGNSPVPGEFPAQRAVTRSFDVFFDLRLNTRLTKQWWGWWFETPSPPLWRERNGDLDMDTKLHHTEKCWCNYICIKSVLNVEHCTQMLIILINIRHTFITDMTSTIHTVLFCYDIGITYRQSRRCRLGMDKKLHPEKTVVVIIYTWNVEICGTYM